LRRAQLGALRAELETLAVHVIAVGNLERHRNRMAVHHARRKLESFRRIEKLLGAGRLQQQRDQRQQRRNKTGKTGHDGFLSKGLFIGATA
jgi:hypothetical protein